MSGILNELDKSLRSYLLRNRIETDFLCRDCGELLLDINNLKNVIVTQSKNGNDVIKYKNKKHTYYVETEHDRWCFFGKIMSGKVFYRHICWNCFFKKLRSTVDIARKARKGKWYKKIADGTDVVPSRCTSPSSYFKLLFDITDEELEKEHIKFATASYDSFVMRFGEEEGKKRYDAYRARQAYTCSKEYMKETRGWSEEQWNKFNASRASTEENYIKRYGEELGKKKWKEYCAHEAYAGNTLTYFIDKFGKDEGTKKYLEVIAKKQFAFKPFSNISQQLFKQIDESYKDAKLYSRWETKNLEHEVFLDIDKIKKIVKVDYYLNGKIIEFNGDFWHANPTIYKAKDIILRPNSQKTTAIECWEADKKRKEALEKLGYKVKIVWEHDYVADPQKVIDECVEFLQQ